MDAKKFLAAGAATLIVGGGLGTAVLANAADPTPTTTPSAGASARPNGGATNGGTTDDQPGQKDGKGHGRMGGHGAMGLVDDETAQAVADKLGIDKTTLTDAAKAVADEMRGSLPSKDQQGSSTGTQGTKPDMSAARDTALTSLAQKLGVDKAALESAIDEARQAEAKADNAAHRDEYKARLDKAVAAGTITQADEDSILKAYDAGVLGGRR